MAERISAPIGACSFIFSNSAGVSLPGLLRMCSGTAILPVSCSSAAASIALSVVLVRDPDSRASAERRCWTRRMWPCVTSSFASIAVASVSTVERYSRFSSSTWRLGVLEPAERRPQRQVTDEQQRQDQRDAAELHLAEREDQQERDRRAGRVARGQRQEVLAPDGERPAGATRARSPSPSGRC